MPSSVRAQTSATSARLPFVIQRFVPLRTKLDPRFSARVRSPDAWLPKSGSVRPKQPIACPDARRGSQRSYWASEP